MTCGYTLWYNSMSTVIFQELEEDQYLEEGMRRVFEKFKLKVCINRVGSMLSFYFNSVNAVGFDDAKGRCQHFKKVFHGMLKRGVYLALQLSKHSLFPDHTQKNYLIELFLHSKKPFKKLKHE